jgi:isopenicillin-N N-acyltransferase-like protein
MTTTTQASVNVRPPIITVRSKDPYERGLSLGSQARAFIRSNVNYYMYLWKTYSFLERDLVLSKCTGFIPAIRRYDKDILEELKGVAEGSHLSLEEIIAINARYEFVWAKMSFDALAKSAECTVVGAIPDVTENYHTLVGQNWDYKPKVKPNCIILEEIQEPDKPNIVMHTEAGIIGQKGMNSNGLGLVVNALVSDKDGFDSSKIPFWIMVRSALNQRTLDRALLAITSADRAVSGNVLLGQAGGEIIDIESTPIDIGYQYPENGVIVHANNFCDLRAKVTDKFKNIVPDSLIRTERARRLLSHLAHEHRVSVKTLNEKVLKDHFGLPNSICRHPDPTFNVDLQAESIASVIFDLEERDFWFSNGQPCSNGLERLRFDSLSLTEQAREQN